MRKIDLLYENNFLLIDDFLPKDTCKWLSTEFLNFCNQNNVPKDNLYKNAHSYYNFKPFVQVLCESVKPLCDYLQEPVLPSFSCGRVYHNQSILEKHIDRLGCEIAISCNLDGDQLWPFYIEDPSGKEHEITMEPGNAIVYLGRNAPHRRNPYEGEFSVQSMFFYVLTYGDYYEHYFDRIDQKKYQ
jgi:hypothetical protein